MSLPRTSVIPRRKSVGASPAPAAAKIMAAEPNYAPAWLAQVEYAPQVRLYAARQTEADAQFGVHLIPPTSVLCGVTRLRGV